MKSTPIYQAAVKRLTEKAADHYIELLFTFPEGEWFAPTNATNEAFNICKHLSDYSLIEIKYTPQYNETTWKGSKVQFRYNKSLKYI